MNPPVARIGATRRALVSRILGACCSVFAALAPAETLSPPQFEPALHRLLQRPCFARAQWGIQVVDGPSGQVLFATNAHTLLKPASNAKLFTAALALDLLGPDYRIVTDLIPAGRLTRRGTLLGDLIVFGRGDFSCAARFSNGDPRQPWRPLVRTLRSAGIHRIRGDLVVDDSYFNGAPFGSGWTWEDLEHWYGAPVGALNAADNVVDVILRPGANPGLPVTAECLPPNRHLVLRTDDLTTGPPGSGDHVRWVRPDHGREIVFQGTLAMDAPAATNSFPVPQPALFFGELFREELIAQGITVRGDVRHDRGGRRRLLDGRSPSPMVLPAASPPLSILVRQMLKASQNLYAQLLLLQAGKGAGAEDLPIDTPSEEAGRRAMAAFLERAGIPSEEARLDDGAGLSRTGLVTPAALTALLRFMDRHPASQVFLEGLPIAGVDGTLRRRLRDLSAEGKLRAKTGTLRYVDALSGWVTHRTGQRWAFAILLNAYDPPTDGPSGREAIDTIARLLAAEPAPEGP